MATRREFLKVGAAAGGGLMASLVLPAFAQSPRAAERARKEPPPERAVGRAATKASDQRPGFAPNGFVLIDRDGQVSFIVHKVEMGQGTFTSIPMLLAEELEVDPTKVKLLQAPADNARYADPLLGGQVTGGSTSVRGAYEPLRRAGATVRTMLVSAAAQAWGVEPATCRAQDGAVVHEPSGRRLHYGELVDRAATLPVPQDVPLKSPEDFRIIGKPVKRLDSAEKVDGRAVFGIDVRLPGMRVATVAASPVRGGKLASVDEAAAMKVEGVRQVLRLPDAVAVVGDHMWAARQGLEAAKPTWEDGPNAGFTIEKLVSEMEAASRQPGAVARNDGNAADVLAASPRRIDAVYQAPFLAHATMEPMNCTVELKPEVCDLWLGTQVPTIAQAAAAKVAGLKPEQVRVHNHYLGGGFGRRLEVDFVVQAVAFAKQVQGPVKFVWTREEDTRQDMYRPYYYDRLSAALDERGLPAAWAHRIVGSSIMSRFAPELVKGGVDPDAVEGARDLLYAIPNLQVDYVRHEPPVPTAFWRGVGPTHNVFVVESFVDELAAAAGQDPLQYRRALLAEQPRALAVLELAARKAGWGTPVQGGEGLRTGRGLSVQHVFGSYMAQVAEVAVDKDGQVRVTRVVCAVDCGQAVNPDTVAAQIEGGVNFGITAALWGEITFENGRVKQGNFDDYRMMRINESPVIEVHLAPSTESPGGIGEPGTSAIAPAVTNAVFAATGKRVRALPIRAGTLRAA